ncbi:MAG: HAMP domain-containing histidine kinase [Clostridia bacterium]|nr:HAMP domain-containing histidine kinase [Clostridia bacterium]
MISKYRKLSISKRLTLQYSVILFTILILFSIMIFFYIRYTTIQSIKAEVSSSADILSRYIRSMRTGSQFYANNVNLSQNVAYSLFNSEKGFITSNRPDLPYMRILQSEDRLAQNSVVVEEARSIVYTMRKIELNDGTYYLLVVNTIDEKSPLSGVLIVTSIFGTVICFLSGIFLTRKLLEPIQEISATAKEITSENLNKRIMTEGPEDEIKELANIFNSMIERLEKDFQKQKRFISDASHELRTPLAIIHGHVNMLRRWGKSDPQVLADSLETLKSETQNMNKLIENLLYLSKGESNALVLNKKKFQINALLQEVVDEVLLIHNGYSISYSCESGLEIDADFNAMKQVLRNLTDNSVKYSSPAGKIEITAEKNNEGLLIKVKDQGIGIPPESLPFIFDRFYRVDESRSKTTGGYGLGLSIVKQIVQSHFGTVSAESEQGKGTTITVYLPSAKSKD